LVADEPTTALDVTVQAQILDLLRKLQRNHKSSIVFITHDMGVIAEIADRVIVMYGGRIVERGLKRDVFLAPQHPYTHALLDSIPPLAGKRPHRLRSIPGSPPSLLDRAPGCAFGPRCPKRFERCSEQPELVGKAHAAACFLMRTA
jgi:peptide/nickel transport system ATP-binding protein